MPLTKPATVIKARTGNLVKVKDAYALGMYERISGSYGGYSYTRGSKAPDIDGKLMFVRAVDYGGAMVTGTDKSGRAYSVHGDSQFVRASKTERAEFIEESRKLMQQFPFGCARGGYHGCDPELFVVDEHGVVIPAFVFLPPKSEAKEELADKESLIHGRDGLVKPNRTTFYDGFQAEFTTPPVTCFGWGADYVRAGIQRVWEAAKKVAPKCLPSCSPVMDIPLDLLKHGPKDGIELGCSPSRNAYTDGVNPKLENLDPYKLPFRFAGYHIHFNITRKNEKKYKTIVKALDAIVGIMSVLLFQGLEDPRRREYYGLAGEFRLPDHGLEYRTLSSCVLLSPYTFHLISDTARSTAVLAQSPYAKCIKANEEEVVRAINTLDVDLASKIFKDNVDVYRMLWNGTYKPTDGNGFKSAEKCTQLVTEGAKKHLGTDMVANWKLKGDWLPHSNDSKTTVYYLRLQ